VQIPRGNFRRYDHLLEQLFKQAALTDTDVSATTITSFR
jgi:hypothetical protein